MSIDLELGKALGLSKNEIKIYETLLEEGECSASHIVENSKIHRRNVHDSLKRLLEKGLVFEILEKRESLYQAVDPQKLREMLEEKQRALSLIMPGLTSTYRSKVRKEAIFIYRGLEAYKNEMRDLIRIGQDLYTIGAKGLWADVRLKDSLEKFIVETRNKKMKIHCLWDYEAGDTQDKRKFLESRLNMESKLLPKEFSTESMTHVFGDHVVFFSKARLSVLDEDITLTVIINQRIADAVRTWFQMLWRSIR